MLRERGQADAEAPSYHKFASTRPRSGSSPLYRMLSRSILRVQKNLPYANGLNPSFETTQGTPAHLVIAVIAVIRATRSMLKDQTLISRPSELFLHLRKSPLSRRIVKG